LRQLGAVLARAATVVSTANPHEVDHLRDRVLLYPQVLLVIDIDARASDAVTPRCSPASR
jgi:hypothetical protein